VEAVYATTTMSLEPTDESPAPGNADDVLAALAAEARRDTLRYFLETTERTATLDELASYVAGRVGERRRPFGGL
jgi:hypothetical protein